MYRVQETIQIHPVGRCGTAIGVLRSPVEDTEKEIFKNSKYVFKTLSTYFILLYKAMVRPHLEYTNAVWCPYKKGDIELIEKVQKRATKLIISLKYLTYSERLKQLHLPTLKYRRLRGDMIEVFKMVHKVL